MTTDDFLREQMERSQRQRTRRRRDGRSRRRHLYLTVGLGILALLVLAAPSLVSHSSIGRSLLIHELAGYGFEATASSVRVGWITPLRITGLKVKGPSGGSELELERLDMELTVTDLISGSGDQWGEVVLRGVHLNCRMREGRCSLEDDLSALLDSPAESAPFSIDLKLQDLTIAVSDEVTGAIWQVAQSSGDIQLNQRETIASFAGVLSDPAGRGGSLQGRLELAAGRWQVDLQSESLPLSVVTLVRRRLTDLADTIPPQVGGDATGALRIARGSDGVIEASLRGLQVRNLTAAEGQSRLWANQLATVDGDLVLSGDRVIGRKLRATTDFATATIDATFPRSVSFAGSQDNPLRWLESLQGSATGEIDLAGLDRALPGVLPLKQNAELVSGRLTAELNSLPSAGNQRRRQLLVRSDQLRARANGRAVMIDPIRLTAIVATNNDYLTAEQFECRSTFANAVGSGNLRSGSANLEIDFGRLCSILRPLVDLSPTDLDGSARGSIRWSASADDVWQLSGSGKATNLVITMPGGKVFRRPSIQSDVVAAGRWGGKSLQQLNEASVTLVGSGLDFRAELIRAVANPSHDTPLPIRLQGNGRIETLAETLSPWLPDQLQEAEGGFVMNASGQVTPTEQTVEVAAIELKMPRIAYANQYFSQPNVKIHFDGNYTLPAGTFQTESLTLLSDAFSAAIRGSGDEQAVDLHVHWKANLERIQGSLRKQIASNPEPAVRQVGYQSGDVVKTEQWLVMGDCQGELGIVATRDQLRLDNSLTGKNLAVVQPPQASLASQIVGPTRPGQAGGPAGTAARVVWSEPNLRVKGLMNMDRKTGQWTTESVNVAGDWFATDLTGNLSWRGDRRALSLRGPARLKMEQVGGLLTRLAGTPIRVEGIHETPLEVEVVTDPNGEVTFDVTGNLGWESGEVAGLQFGPATAAVRWNETSVSVSPTVIPVGNGELNLAGEVHYRPGPLWLRAQPGQVARSVELTPEITGRWMKYLAPLVADATRVEGSFSAELDKAIVVFEQPELSHVVGRLDIAGAQMTAGPLANQIINGVQQLKAIARLSDGLPPPVNQKLISMPPQSVEFIVDRGVVSHKTLFFEVDRAQVVTSGRVAFDGRLDMVAQVPLDARWLGSDLQGLAGQPVTLPIDGTLSRPSLDSRGVSQVVSQLGTQAIQSTAENYLQQQINRGIDRLFGR